MYKSEKYDIKNFYVGELYISTKINQPLILLKNKLTKENENKYKIQNKTIMNGAIDINNHFHLYKDGCIKWYKGHLTIFYKQNDNYICLHNENAYRLTGEDFCDNLYRLDSILPKISYNYPKEISTKNALKLFKQLFDKNYIYKQEKFYNYNPYKLEDFYVGSLAFCCDYKSLEIGERITKNIDTPQRYMLYKSDANLSYITGCVDDKKNIEYNHLHFNTLFLKRNKEMYNLHNFKIYNFGTLEKKHYYEYEQSESYYECMVPFKELLEENNIKYNSNDITIPKALKLYRKVK